FTGHCPGLAAGDLDDYHPALTPQSHPVFTTLYAQGPCGLAQRAAEAGWCERAEGYVSKCDLCYQVRRFLRPMHGDIFGPAELYAGSGVNCGS
ncbi:MAG: hypothetical protein ACLFV7_14725, partial [Phycisphaerae bacterium]